MRYVLAVADTGNFTRAAEQCHVVQSALSHQIARLERELGVRLFARTSRRVELTPAGEAFLPAARACLEAAERAAADAAAASGKVCGRLAVGAITTVTAVNIPATLHTMRENYPLVTVSLRTDGSDQLSAAIVEGSIDVAFLGLPDGVLPPATVQHRLVARDQLVAVVAPSHPLAEQGHTTVAEIAAETFVDFPSGTPGRAQSDLAFAGQGLTRDVAFEVTHAELLLDLVKHQLGIGMLTARYAARYPEVRAVPIADGPHRNEYVAWTAFNPSPAALTYLSILQTMNQGGLKTLGKDHL